MPEKKHLINLISTVHKLNRLEDDVTEATRLANRRNRENASHPIYQMRLPSSVQNRFPEAENSLTLALPSLTPGFYLATPRISHVDRHDRVRPVSQPADVEICLQRDVIQLQRDQEVQHLEEAVDFFGQG